jgi:hypothetical protein
MKDEILWIIYALSVIFMMATPIVIVFHFDKWWIGYYVCFSVVPWALCCFWMCYDIRYGLKS